MITSELRYQKTGEDGSKKNVKGVTKIIINHIIIHFLQQKPPM